MFDVLVRRVVGTGVSSMEAGSMEVSKPYKTGLYVGGWGAGSWGLNNRRETERRAVLQTARSASLLRLLEAGLLGVVVTDAALC